MVYPEAHQLSEGDFFFGQWSPDQPEHTFPEHMLFLQSDVSDPGVDTPLEYAYFIPHDDYHEDDTVGYPYSATRRTRLNGLDEAGISFINTGRERDLGGALLALDTQSIEAVVNWAGFVKPCFAILLLRYSASISDRVHRRVYRCDAKRKAG